MPIIKNGEVLYCEKPSYNDCVECIHYDYCELKYTRKVDIDKPTPAQILALAIALVWLITLLFIAGAI